MRNPSIRPHGRQRIGRIFQRRGKNLRLVQKSLPLLVASQNVLQDGFVGEFHAFEVVFEVGLRLAKEEDPEVARDGGDLVGGDGV